MGTRVLATTFLIALGLVTWDELSNQRRFPHPDRYMHVMWAWIMLGVIDAIGAPEIAAAFGVGFDLAMAYKFITSKSVTTDEQQLQHHDSYPAAAIAPTTPPGSGGYI